MSSRFATGLSISLLGLIVAFSAAGLVFLSLTWSAPSGEQLPAPAPGIVFVLAALSLGLVGGLLAFSRPSNVIGWLLLGCGLWASFTAFTGRYLAYSLIVEPDTSLPSLNVLLSSFGVAWLGMVCCLVLTLISFPQGKPATRFMRKVAYSLTAIAGLAILTAVLSPAQTPGPFQDFENELAVDGADWITIVSELAIGVFVLLAMVAAIDMVRRFLRSSGDEREQFKWFAYVAGWLPLLIASWGVAEALEPDALHIILLLNVAVLGVAPIAIGVAVMKHRLYDIDVIINKTLVYVPLTAVLAGLFVAVTGLVRTIFTGLTGTGSDAAIAMSTLAVVALLTPVKNQLQALVDRYFKEGSEQSRALLKVTEHTQSVLAVLDREVLVERFLKGVMQAYDLAGAEITLHGWPQYAAVTGAGGEPTLTLSLEHNGRDLGELRVGPRKGGRAFTAEELTSLSDSVRVLSQALAALDRLGMQPISQASNGSVSLSKETEPASLG